MASRGMTRAYWIPEHIAEVARCMWWIPPGTLRGDTILTGFSQGSLKVYAIKMLPDRSNICLRRYPIPSRDDHRVMCWTRSFHEAGFCALLRAKSVFAVALLQQQQQLSTEGSQYCNCNSCSICAQGKRNSRHLFKVHMWDHIRWSHQYNKVLCCCLQQKVEPANVMFALVLSYFHFLCSNCPGA